MTKGRGVQVSEAVQPSKVSIAVLPANRARLPDLLGIAWVVAAGVAVLIPALIHGIYLGPFDILSTNGLTAQQGGVVHNFDLRDLITSFIPSTEQAWMQVHNGHLPLWNPYSALGLPLAFNWQSAPFGLPALVGYLVPLHWAFTVGVLVTVVVAGTGGYVFARVLRLGVIPSAFVGTIFVLSGSMVALLGWSATSVGSWSGWLFATAILVVRGNRRGYAIAAFALVLAMTVYAGHPETAFLVSLTLVIFLAVVLVQRTPGFGTFQGPILRPVIDLGVGAIAGLGLAAPLLLPGIQMVGQSVRSSSGNYASLTTPDHGELQLIFQGFDGLPVIGNHWFGQLSYQWDSAYVGVIALVMVVLALRFRWRQPEVAGLVAASVVMATLVLVPGVPSALSGVPIIGNIVLTRALIALTFGLSVLAGIGLDVLMREHASARVRRWALGAFGAAALALGATWLFGRGHLPLNEARIREASFLWPAICAVVGLAAVGGLYAAIRRGGGSDRKVAWTVGVLLLACETGFLVAAGAPLSSSSPSILRPSPAVISLQKTVGSSLVGLGSQTCIVSTYVGTNGLGILPEANILFQVHELATYDPLVPGAYFSTWRSLTGNEGGSTYFLQFCPAVTTVRTARRFGVSYVLEVHDAKGPVGSSFVDSIGGEDLYHIPGAAAATIVPAPSARVLPADDAAGTPVTVHHPNPATWSIVTDAATPAVLRLRLTDVPGWHATIDGRPLALQEFSGVMLQARIPPGRHSISVHYWPRAFSLGLVLAACSAVGLFIAGFLEWTRRKSRSRTAN
jgi:hypothetical protein